MAINHRDIFGIKNEVKSEIGVLGRPIRYPSRSEDPAKSAISELPAAVRGNGSLPPASRLDSGKNDSPYMEGADCVTFESAALLKFSESCGGARVGFGLTT